MIDLQILGRLKLKYEQICGSSGTPILSQGHVERNLCSRMLEVKTGGYMVMCNPATLSRFRKKGNLTAKGVLEKTHVYIPNESGHFSNLKIPQTSKAMSG